MSGTPELLTASLPLRPSRATASKLAAIVIAAGVPLALMFAAAALATLLSVSPFIAFRSTMPLALLGVSAAWVAAGLALGVAPGVRGAFKVFAVTLLLGAFAPVVGALGSWASLWWFVQDYQELAARWTHHAPEVQRLVSAVAQRGTWIAGGMAMLIVGLAGWLSGVATMLRLVSPRSCVVALAAALACSFVAAIVATGVVASTDVGLRDSIAAAQLAANRASDAEIGEATSRWVSAGQATKWRNYWGGRSPAERRDFTMVGEGQRRLHAMPVEARRGNPMLVALQPIHDEWARDCNGRVPFWFVVDADQRLRTAIDCLLRSPEGDDPRTSLLTVLASFDPTLGSAWTPGADREARRRAQTATIVEGLQGLIAEGHGDAALLQRAIDAVAPQLRDE